jgi:hypothetical protein
MPVEPVGHRESSRSTERSRYACEHALPRPRLLDAGWLSGRGAHIMGEIPHEATGLMRPARSCPRSITGTLHWRRPAMPIGRSRPVPLRERSWWMSICSFSHRRVKPRSTNRKCALSRISLARTQMSSPPLGAGRRGRIGLRMTVCVPTQKILLSVMRRRCWWEAGDHPSQELIPLSPAPSVLASTAGTRFSARKSTNTLSLGARCLLDGHRIRRGPERSV